MAKSLNKVFLIGNLGDEVEVQYTRTGKPVALFSIATNRSWKDDTGELHEETDWHRIVAWGPMGEACKKYIGKGNKVHVEGRIQTRSFEDQNHPGVTRYITEIVASNIIFLTFKQQATGEQVPTVREDVEQGPAKEDLPF